MTKINYQFHKTPIGELILGSFNDKLCLLDFRYRKMRNLVDQRLKNGLNADFIENNSQIIDLAKTQIDEYLKGIRKKFEVPIITVGTPFQKKVWNALFNIEYGQKSSYLYLANAIGNKNACRAVAAANCANSIALIIPCHRIIASDGGLGGYSGGISVKQKILDLEQAFTTNYCQI